MGHSNIAVAMRYAHLAPDALDTALAAMEGAPMEVGHPMADEGTHMGGNLMENGTASEESAPKSLNLVGRVGVEPTTKRLRVSCSTN